MRIRLASFGFLFLFASTLALADHDHDGDDRKQRLGIEALNSPVKESLAKFQLTLPSGMTATNATYRFEEAKKQSSDDNHGHADTDKKTATRELLFKLNEKPRELTLTVSPQGLEAQIPVSELPPGSFAVWLEVRANKTWMEMIRGFFSRRNESEEFKGKADFVIDASLEVPDPGPAGLTTLTGVDSDNDGVRDDVQRWINENYNAGASPNINAALKQSRGTFSRQLSTTDKPSSIEASRQFLQSMNVSLYFMVG